MIVLEQTTCSNDILYVYSINRTHKLTITDAAAAADDDDDWFYWPVYIVQHMLLYAEASWSAVTAYFLIVRNWFIVDNFGNPGPIWMKFYTVIKA